MSVRALIVGYGNPLRGDDGFGLAAIDAFVAEGDHPGVTVMRCHQLTPELADDLAGVNVAVFVDASTEPLPGRVVVTLLRPETAPPVGLAHHVAPGVLLTMAAALYGRAPTAFLVTVGADSFELGDGLSERVAAALPEAVAALRRLVSAP
jgi:hydrogenase maturation protease